MYNKERKQEYLRYIVEDLEQTPSSAKSLFNKTESYEELLDKDICDFTLSEIDKLLPIFLASSLNAIRKIISILRKYTDWCCSCNISIDNINHYDELGTSAEYLQKYLNKEKAVCPSRAQVLEDISQFKNFSDKFLILALFEGVRTEEVGELLRVKISKLNGNILTFENGEKRILSEELVELAKASSQEEEYISSTGNVTSLNMEGNIVNSRKNIRSNTLEALNLRLTSRLIVLRKEENIPYLTIPRLYTAGIVEQLKDIMEKYGVSKETIFEEQYIKKVNSNYNINGYTKKALRIKYYNYL
jgi:hypothetical protein